METNGNKEVKLTAKEERFCYQYVLLLNATKAAISAGYAERSANVTGCRLLTKPNIQGRVEQLKRNLSETAEISALKVLKEHEKIAFADAGQLRDGWISLKDFDSLTPEQKAIIQEVSTKEGKFGTEVKIKLFDKQRALDAISSMLGFDAPVKTELTGKDGKDLFATLTDEELQAKIADLKGKLEP
ncbi:MAG: terminase small subunit [Tannerellaceae bacterium]|jgi:phage terminase small subunit|nr:terminase small subunit [Tannerellaceae bacterium]